MLLDDIYVMWIPIVVIALMAALGYWRGAYRELLVSASIVLSALVAVQWATQERWALDLSNTFSGLGAGEWQFFLTLVLMGLIVAVVGYGLGGLFARRGLSSTGRTLGLVLGLANGAALSGWVLRAAYEGLVNRQDTSAVYQNPVSLTLMVWAGWFPVVLAVIGAIGALVYSLTGEKAVQATDVSVTTTQTHVAQPQTRDAYVPPVYQPIVIPPAQARVDHFMPVTAELISDAYGNTFAPEREQAAIAPTVANPVASIPNYNTNYDVAPAQTDFAHDALPVRPVTADNKPSSSSTELPARITFEPSPHPQTLMPESGPVPHTPPFGYDLAALWGQNEADTSLVGNTPGALSEPSLRQAQASAVDSSAGSGERRCRNCGNILQPGAVFCTECGMRTTESI